MPAFKPKATKKIKISKRNSTTLDGKHCEFINEFFKDEHETIPKLNKERKELVLQLNTENLIENKMEIKDRIKSINEKIHVLKYKKRDYLLDNSKYIFEYFENKKNISNGDPVELMSKNKILDNFFKIQNTKNGEESRNKNIVQQYLSNVDDSFLDINLFVRPTDVCQYCFKGELIPLDDESVLICNVCYKNVPYLIENDKPSYK